MNDQPYTPARLAERWECGEGTIRKMIAAGDLRAFMVGDKLSRIPVDEVERIESSGQTVTDSDYDDSEQSEGRAFSVASLAEYWSCSTGLVYNMIKRGDLNAPRLGDKLFRITAAEVERIEGGSI